MIPRAYTRQEVVAAINNGTIFYFSDIFNKCKYPMIRAAGAVSTKKDRLNSITHRPYEASVKEIYRIAWYFDVHYLVIWRLMERQMEEKGYPRSMLITTFRRPYEQNPFLLDQRYGPAFGQQETDL